MSSVTAGFQSTTGRELFYRSWLSSKPPKGVVVICHGYCEYGDRYTEFAGYLNGLGYHVYAHDHVGHGRSEGPRAHIRRFETFVDDLAVFMEMVENLQPGLPLFLFGQSMGGIISLLYAARGEAGLSGLVLSAPALCIALQYSPFLKWIAKVIAAVLPRLKFDKSIAENLSRDPRVIEEYKADPLVYSGKNRIGFGNILLQLETWVTPEISKLKLPLLVMHGTEDKIADPKSSRLIYEQAESEDKTLHWFNALYHELLHEPEKKEVMKLVGNWIVERSN